MIRDCVGMSRPFPDLAGACIVDAHSASSMSNGVRMSGHLSM